MNIATKHHDLVRLYTISREREEGNFWKFWKANLKKLVTIQNLKNCQLKIAQNLKLVNPFSTYQNVVYNRVGQLVGSEKN